jgi:DNA-binding transcriptional LysR family regulator
LPDSFRDVVGRFIARYPALRLEILATARHVDLMGEGYDLALRAGAAVDSGLVGRTLRRERLYAVAAPAYLEAHGAPESTRALGGHACILGYTRAELPETHWPLLRGGSVRVEGRLHASDLFLRRALAADGHGITLLPSIMIEDAVRRGHLAPVLERVVGAQNQLMLVYPERKLVTPAVRAFVEAISRWAQTALEAWAPPVRPGRHVRRLHRPRARRSPET